MIRYTGIVAIEKSDSLGKTFTVYREVPEMPRIADRFLDCSIYLYKSESEARNGVAYGGSGFLAAIPGYGKGWLIEGRCPQHDFHHCYAVTNAHVAKKIQLSGLIRKEPRQHPNITM